MRAAQLSATPELRTHSVKICNGGIIVLRSVIMYDFDWAIASPVIDIHTTQLAQETLLDGLGATHAQQGPWQPGLPVRSGPRGVSPGQLPELGSRMTAVPDSERPIGNFWDWIQTLEEDQNRVDETRSVQVRKRKSCLVIITLMQTMDQGSRQLFTTHQGLSSGTEWC